MAKIGIIKYFKASHGTTNKHEHNFKVEVVLEGQLKNNMVDGVDFHDVKKVLKEELDKLEGKYLNEYLGVKATVENIAIHILRKLKSHSYNNIYMVKLFEEEDRFIEIYGSEIEK